MTPDNTTTAAFFISPGGELIWVNDKHILTVIREPQRFGLTRDEIQAVYRAYGEKPGQEGKASKEILLKLIKKGWIRIRRYPERWKINSSILTPEIRARLSSWAVRILAGVHEFKELDKYMPVVIVGCDFQEHLVVEKLAGYGRESEI